MQPNPTEDFDPDAFSGVARLFPLPAATLYPRLVLPLHIFEERYRELMEDAIAGDQLIAMSVLRPGWEPDYASRPPLEDHACLGKIVAHHQMEDGRYNLLLAGLSRIRILDEIEPPRSFRRAEVKLLADVEPEESLAETQSLHQQLADAFRSALPHGVPPEPLQQAFEPDTPVGMLADVATHLLPLSREVKQAVLAEPDAVARARIVVAAIEKGGFPPLSQGPNSEPPPFSMN